MIVLKGFCLLFRKTLLKYQKDSFIAAVLEGCTKSINLHAALHEGICSETKTILTAKISLSMHVNDTILHYKISWLKETDRDSTLHPFHILIVSSLGLANVVAMSGTLRKLSLSSDAETTVSVYSVAGCSPPLFTATHCDTHIITLTSCSDNVVDNIPIN